MSSSSATHSAVGATPSFAARFDRPLPRELRRQADAMTDEAFRERYTPSVGPVRLGAWQCTDTNRPATRLGPQPRNYQATIAIGDRIGTATAAASGPIAALTAMLHDRGTTVEIAALHQLHADGETATFIRGTDGVRTEWAMGCSADAVQSALRAVVACANRLAHARA